MAEDQEFYSLKLYTDMYGESPPLNKSAVRSEEPKNKSVDSIDKSLENILR